MPCPHLSKLRDRYPIECPARVLRRVLNIALPPQMTWELCALVATAARDKDWIPSPQTIWLLFRDEYLAEDDFYSYVTHEILEREPGGSMHLSLKLRYGGQGMVLRGLGGDLHHAIIDALGWDFGSLPCILRSDSATVAGRMVVFTEISIPERYTLSGIGLGENQTTASIMAILSAFNRALRQGALDDCMRTASSET